MCAVLYLNSPPFFLVTTAKLFNVEYLNNYKLVYVRNSFGDNETYALYQCGTPVPENLPPGIKNFSIPLTSVAVNDSSVIPFLEVKDK